MGAPRLFSSDQLCNMLLDITFKNSSEPVVVFFISFPKTKLLLLAFQYDFSDLLSAW